MLDIKRLRQDKEKLEAFLKRKDPSININSVLQLDEKRRAIKTELEQLLQERNASSKKIGALVAQKAPVDELKQQVRQIGEKIKELEEQSHKTQEDFLKELSALPNIPEEEIKDSQDKNDNETIKVVGEKPAFNFAPKNHLELNEKLHLFDFHKTAKTTGAGWPGYRGIGARLEWALISYMIDVQVLNGFELWLPPLMVRPQMMYASGQLPKFEGQFYKIAEKQKEHELYLLPTAEVVLNGLHYDEIIEPETLPVKYAAFTPCFRREAGASGANERGLIRVHQFNKVEMFAFADPEKSQEMLEHMTDVAEEIMKGLGLHYRLAKLVTGDMSFTAAKTIDLEVWLPGQNRYYEVSSLSNCTDYQARRSQIRTRTKEGFTQFVHTLNGSGLATPRLMVALLENYQNEDGSVDLPPVLQEKLGVKRLEPNRS